MKIALFLCFLAFVSAQNQDCQYQFESIQNAVFSLQASVNSEDIIETQANLNSIFNIALLINNFCADTGLVFQAKEDVKPVECEESFDFIEEAIDNFYANPKSFDAVQRLLDVSFVLQISCENNIINQDLQNTEVVSLKYDENKLFKNETTGDNHDIPAIYLGEDDDEIDALVTSDQKVVEISNDKGFLSQGVFSGNIFSFF